jgi:hypothetical protein
MKEGLEGWVQLGGGRFPRVKILEGEDVGLEENADGICNDLVIRTWKFSDLLDFLTLLDAVEERISGKSVGFIGLRHKVSLLNKVIIFGFSYESWSWSRITLMDIVEFHPVRNGVLETLNWAAIFALNMRNHARAIFLYDKKYFLS